MRRTAAMILTMMLILLCLSAQALGNSGIRNQQAATEAPAQNQNVVFVTPAPAKVEEREFSILSVVSNGDGTVNVIWEDSFNYGPYDVGCIRLSGANPDAAESNGMLQWRLQSNLNVTKCTLTDLIPGHSYYIVVEDKYGEEIYYAYKPEKTNFSEFKVKADLSPRTKVGDNKASAVKQFSIADFRANSDAKSYGAYIRLDYPQLKKAREYNATVALVTPRGDDYVVDYSELDLPSGNHYSYWTFFNLTGALSDLDRRGGLVPGTYSWVLYFEDYYVCEDTFTVVN